MKLALVKLIVSFLASFGFFAPHHGWLHCAPGKTPRSAPSSCERIRV